MPFDGKFKPGVSGNPAGRPRLTAAERAQRREQKRLAREISLRQLDVVILTRQHAEMAVDVLAKILKSTQADDMVKLRAVGELFDRAFGKPTETSFNVNADASVSPEATRQMQERANAALERLRGRYAAPPPALEGEANRE